MVQLTKAVEAEVIEVVTDDSAVELTVNQQIRDAGLWKPGCQFLSNADKAKLLTASTSTKNRIYKRVQEMLTRMKENAANREYKYSFSEKSVQNGVNVFGDIVQLKEFMTPVYEDKVYFSNGRDLMPAPNHKAIVNQDGKIVSVMNNGYKLIRNEDVVLPLLEKLDKFDNKWYIDKSHSYINDTKMRMQITFPELTFNDNDSEIAMSLFISNSYDGSSSVRVTWGAIRGICSNGMVFGKAFADYYHRHSSFWCADDLNEKIEESFKLVPSIAERVKLLGESEFKITEEKADEIRDTLGRKAIAYVEQENGENADQIKTEWDLYNILTYYVSHYVNYRTRANYQVKMSNMFNM